MPEDDFYDRTLHPGAETVLRGANQRETLPHSQERPLEPPPWQIGQQVADFVIEAMLGSGVTSTVYRVKQTTTGKRFALKVLRVRSEETLAASRLGYRRVMPLAHPSLVRIYSMHQLDGMIAFTMEEVVGEPISKMLRSIAGDRELVFRLAAQLTHDIGGALQTLHAAGLVHRDVKPDNLLVEPSGAIRLIDYGLVGCFDPESDPDARRSYLAGTYWYMAPESISSQIYPPACDVYALGCVLLELIADPARLPDPQQGRSLGEAVGELDRIIPTDTPDELRELLQEMLDAKIENRPLASQVVRYGRSQLMPAGDTSLLFRPTDLIGRETEMRLAENWFHDVARSGTGWLHISGESGTGKTWFAAELRRRLSSNRWFQVFSSTCLRRDDVSLQIFDEMVDAIARRYIRDDRDPLRLSETSARILLQSFPALRPVIRSEGASEVDAKRRGDDATGFSGGEETRSHALRAGVEFIDRLCEYGPVLLIIDELQWADQDSIHVLDSLLDEVSGKCGIVTISPNIGAPLRHSAQQVIRLDPLDQDQSLRLLRNVLGSEPLGTDDQAFETLAKMGQGNAFRLTQLAASFASGDNASWHERLRDGAVDAEELWQSKLDLLDNSARRCLRFLATAGGPVSTELLGQVAGLDSEADLMAWELIRHRLARESTADGTEIEVAHSRIADRVVRSLDASEKAELHLRWANHLKQQDEAIQRTLSYAPRIAWHLLEAGRDSDAAPYAQQAAADALHRFAYTEAARWFARVADLIHRDQAGEPLLRALECYETAGHPSQAAEICQKLLDDPGLDPTSPQADEFQRRLAENLFRCGRLPEARLAVERLAKRFGLPRRKPSWLSPVSIGIQFLGLAWARRCAAWGQWLGVSSRSAVNIASDATRGGSQRRLKRDEYSERYVRVSMSLARPMSLYDNSYALELILAGMRALNRSAEPSLRLAAQVPYAVIGSYNPGPRREEGEKILQQVTATAQLWGAAESLAEVHSGWGQLHFLLGQWAPCAVQSQLAIDHYTRLGERNSFEINHMRFPLLWSLYALGRFSNLRSLTQQMSRQADERSDRFMHQVTHAGLAGVSWLVIDDPVSMRKRHLEAADFLRGTDAAIADLIAGLAPTLRWIYLDRPQSALRYIQVLVTGKRTVMLRRMQILRVLYEQYSTLAALRLASMQPAQSASWLAKAEKGCRRLHQEATPYAELMAVYHAAQISEQKRDLQRSRCLYEQAIRLANEQQILPIEYAATDQLEKIDGTGQGHSLRQHLVAEGVSNPARFARLFGVDAAGSDCSAQGQS